MQTETGKNKFPVKPVQLSPPKDIEHAFLKRVALIIFAIFVHLYTFAVMVGALVAIYYLFKSPSTGVLTTIIRIVAGGWLVYVFTGPVFIGRFRGNPDDHLGKIVKPSEQPELFDIIRDAARDVGSSTVRVAMIRPDAMKGIDLGNGLPWPLGRQQKVIIGLAGLVGWTVHDLKTVMAHELAHKRLARGWTGGFVRGSLVLISSIVTTIFTSAVFRLARFINPVYWVYRLLLAIGGPWAEEILKWHEYKADEAAGKIFGHKSIVETQNKAIVNSFVFDMATEKAIRWLKEKKFRIDDIFTYIERIGSAMDEHDRKQIVFRSEVLIGRFDATHPSPAARAEAVEEYECKVEVDENPATSVFRDIPALHRELTNLYYNVLAKYHKLVLDGAVIVSAAELGLSYTGAELENILEGFFNISGSKGLQLGFDRESLEKADRYLAAHPEFFAFSRNRDIIGELILYFGETVRRLHGGEWVFPMVAPPRLEGVGPKSMKLEVYEVFMSELAASNYPSVMPAYVRAMERLGIEEERPAWGMGNSTRSMV